MFNFGPGEITVMVLFAILSFGPKKPPSALLAATAAFTLLSAARY